VNAIESDRPRWSLVGKVLELVRRNLGSIWIVVRSAIDRNYRALAVAQRNSLATRERLLGLRQLATTLAEQRLSGHVVECGVYRGGSAVVLADQLLSVSPTTQMWLYDVFSGMPPPGPEDPPEAWNETGKFPSSEAIVRQTFRSAGVSDARVHVVVGRYEDTLRSTPTPSPIQFLHLDCDWYASVRLCLETLYDAVLSGGVIVLDDYGHWSGCRRAVDEFLAARGLSIELTPIDYTSHYFIKP
jgi:O-methyltransferase